MKRDIKKIYNDIVSLKIQGATNVAKSCVNGMLVFAIKSGEKDQKALAKNVKEVGRILSLARDNEPLARNAVKYISAGIDRALKDDFDIKKQVKSSSVEFFDILKTAKTDIVNNGVQELSHFNNFLTHCHSSTTENILKGLRLLDKQMKVTVTETRPRYQGRITAKKLLQAKIDVTLIVDSAIDFYLIQKLDVGIEAIIIGCDELSPNGTLINKIGSLSIALAAKEAGIPLYVSTTLLKVNTSWGGDVAGKKIEIRDASEVWKDAPKKLKIYNPAFGIVEPKYISGYITEQGVISSRKILSVLNRRYPWAV